MVGIQKIIYPETDFTFVIWRTYKKFNELNSPTGAQLIGSTSDFLDISNRTHLDRQVFLLGKSSENPSIEDDFDCVFLQGNRYDVTSNACIKEKQESSNDFCQYWQKCSFMATKRENCTVVKANVAALTVSTIVLLIIVISAFYYFKKKAICCFKKQADSPQVNQVQISTRSRGKKEFNEYNSYNEYNEYEQYQHK